MRDKILTGCLIVLIVFFIPIFITTLFDNSKHYENKKDNLSVKIDYGQGVMEVSLDTYLMGVVAAEMPASFGIEALKAQAIAARTYIAKRIEENSNTVFTKQLLSYYSDQELEEIWGVNQYAFNYSKIKRAVEETDQQVILYQGELIDAIFHSTSIGRTRPALEVWGEDIPYLKSAESLEDINASTYLHNYNFSYNVFSQILMANHNDIVISEELLLEMQIIERSTSGYVLKLQVGNKIFTGEEFRRLFDLASSCFSMTVVNNQINLVCKGMGHGVGMSQVGANTMALEGADYEEIIAHYYQDVQIEDMQHE